jgi:thioredoxin-related protein
MRCAFTIIFPNDPSTIRSSTHVYRDGEEGLKVVAVDLGVTYTPHFVFSDKRIEGLILELVY